MTFSPAAASTLLAFFEDTGTAPEDYDIIYTGDLGYVGSNLLYELMEKEGYDIRCRHSDCGLIIYDREKQDVHAGGSGCGCSASVLCSFIMNRFLDGTFKNIPYESPYEAFMNYMNILTDFSQRLRQHVPSVDPEVSELLAIIDKQQKDISGLEKQLVKAGVEPVAKKSATKKSSTTNKVKAADKAPAEKKTRKTTKKTDK